jgi:hypothetical protein
MSDTNDAGTIKAAELDNYQFGNETPPQGFDPNAEGWEAPPVGVHLCECFDFEIKPNNVFNGPKTFGQWIGNQLRPKMRVVGGQPHEGTSKMDFLPMPTPGAPMPVELANRWANFINALGFTPPPNSVVPAGLKLHNILGAQCLVEIVEDTYEGKVQRKVKFFGYKRAPSTGAPPQSATTGRLPAQAVRAPTAAPVPVDIGSL